MVKVGLRVKEFNLKTELQTKITLLCWPPLLAP
jgi:hypothetical protein